MRTIVYVDGFNLYYGALRGTPYKWLDPLRLSRLLLPGNQILKLKYFTSRVKARPEDLGQPLRQQVYLRALGTIPNLQTILGHFLTHAVTLPRVDGSGLVRVLRTEEKGSDVNLATHLLRDAFSNEMDVGVLVTNDSDLVEAVRIVVGEVGLTVGVLTPTMLPGRRPSRVLRRHATFFKPIREGVLARSQFPEKLRDKKGIIKKPFRW